MTDYAHLTTYQLKALQTRARRAAADKRYALVVAQRRIAFQAKLDAIVAAKAGAK